jgi:uncharacterized protein YjbJ (UPF0337 family)
MDKDRIKGKAKQVEGRVRDAAGGLTGNTSEQIKGKVEQAEGKIQEEWGKSKDAVRKAANRP